MKKGLFKNKAILFYLCLYGVYLVLALTAGALHRYAVYNIPPEIFHMSILEHVIRALEALHHGLKDWFWILLIYWGAQLIQQGKKEKYSHLMAASVLVIAATQAVAFGSAALLHNVEIRPYLSLFAIFTAVVFAAAALILGIFSLKKPRTDSSVQRFSHQDKAQEF